MKIKTISTIAAILALAASTGVFAQQGVQKISVSSFWRQSGGSVNDCRLTIECTKVNGAATYEYMYGNEVLDYETKTTTTPKLYVGYREYVDTAEISVKVYDRNRRLIAEGKTTTKLPPNCFVY